MPPDEPGEFRKQLKRDNIRCIAKCVLLLYVRILAAREISRAAFCLRDSRGEYREVRHKCCSSTRLYFFLEES